MIVGILLEGSSDKNTLKNLVRRIAEGVSVEINEIKIYPASGKIQTKINAAAEYFSQQNCEIMILVGDTGGNSDECQSIIRGAERLRQRGYKVAVGCPDPELEKWFLDEADSLKNLLGIPGDQSLPEAKNNNAKVRLRTIIAQNFPITKPSMAVYEEISRGMNLTVLCRRSSSYKKFHQEVRNALS